MTTYYVSSEIGSNNNAGTSSNAPYSLNLQAAANVVKPGNAVQVMNGTYTAPTYADALDITTSGTATAPITLRRLRGGTSLTVREVGTPIKASYIVVKGFTVVGDAANYTLQSALAGYSGNERPGRKWNSRQSRQRRIASQPHHDRRQYGL